MVLVLANVPGTLALVNLFGCQVNVGLLLLVWYLVSRI